MVLIKGVLFNKKSTLQDLFLHKSNLKEAIRILNLLKKVRYLNLNADFRSKCNDLILTDIVKSQDLQDIKAYLFSDEKQNRFYVEFGADDGIKNSNTFLLNKNFG